MVCGVGGGALLAWWMGGFPGEGVREGWARLGGYPPERGGSFFEDALWGGGGVPTGAGLVDGGVDQGRIFVVSNAYKKKKNGFF